MIHPQRLVSVALPVLSLLLLGLLGCGRPSYEPRDADDPASDAEQLGPGMARVSATVLSCGTDDEGAANSFPCTVRLERTYASGPQTTHPSAGTALTVNVYPSHFRDLSEEDLRERLQSDRTLDLTLQQEGAGDEPRTWRLVRF